LEEKHIDFNTLTLNLSGNIMKNHKMLQLPIDNKLAHLLQVLIQQNEKIREYQNQKNENIIPWRASYENETFIIRFPRIAKY